MSLGLGLFGRRVYVEAGPPGGKGKRYDGLRISFRANHSGGRHPSRATVSIYNVPPDAIGLFKPRRNRIKLMAGYGETVPMLFQGNPVRNGLQYVQASGGDLILSVEISDGGAGYTSSFISRTFSGKTKWSTVLDAALDAAGWDRGDIELPSGIALPSSTTFTDRVPEVMDRIAQLIPGGGEWFVRDNALFVKKLGTPTSEGALLISQEQGNLIGTPTTTSKGVKVRALIDSTLRPARRIRVKHDRVSGFYRVTDVQFSGDSGFGNEFYMDIEAKALGVST